MKELQDVISTNVEEWKPIPNWEGYYEASNLGRIRSVDRDIVTKSGKTQHWKSQIITATINKTNGYAYVRLNSPLFSKSYTVHRLIALSFVLNPDPTKFNQVNHKDENRTNNTATNLEWCDCSYNLSYGSRKEKQVESLKRFYKTPDGQLLKSQAGQRGAKYLIKYNTSTEHSDRVKQLHAEGRYDHVYNNITRDSSGKFTKHT